jgi:hypothetical protein
LDTINVETELKQDFKPGLAKVRRRRWFLWLVLLGYLPTMWTAQQITRSFQGALPVFFAWILLLTIAAAVSALARCPRCGNYFHVNGMALLYLRKCLHCQLPINADRK